MCATLRQTLFKLAHAHPILVCLLLKQASCLESVHQKNLLPSKPKHGDKLFSAVLILSLSLPGSLHIMSCRQSIHLPSRSSNCLLHTTLSTIFSQGCRSTAVAANPQAPETAHRVFEAHHSTGHSTPALLRVLRVPIIHNLMLWLGIVQVSHIATLDPLVCRLRARGQREQRRAQ
mgnify:CR=1 FL=1